MKDIEPEELLFIMNLTENGKEYKLDKKPLAKKYKSICFACGTNEVRELDSTFKSILAENLENDALAKDLTVRIDLNIDTNENDLLKFDQISFFHTKLGITKYDYTKRAYTSKKSSVISGIDKIHSKGHFSVVIL